MMAEELPELDELLAFPTCCSLPEAEVDDAVADVVLETVWPTEDASEAYLPAIPLPDALDELSETQSELADEDESSGQKMTSNDMPMAQL